MAIEYDGYKCNGAQECDLSCSHCHRKHPTPEQYKKEYGEDVPPEMPVWVLVHATPKINQLPDTYVWSLEQYGSFAEHNTHWNLSFKNMTANFYHREIVAVCVACTPWGKPPDTWRLE